MNGGQSHAPLASNDGKPVPVEVVNPSLGTHITNPHALVHGISQGQANNLSQPPTGISGPDIRIDQGAAFSPLLPLP